MQDLSAEYKTYNPADNIQLLFHERTETCRCGSCYDGFWFLFIEKTDSELPPLDEGGTLKIN